MRLRFLFLSMIFSILSLIFMNPGTTTAANNSFSKSDNDVTLLKTDELKKRFRLTGEAYLTDASGEVLLRKLEEERKWRPADDGKIDNFWQLESKGFPTLALYHQWEVLKDGKIHAKIEQYEKFETNAKGDVTQKVKLIRSDEFNVKDFSPTTWVAFDSIGDKKNKRRISVRFTPQLIENSESEDLGDFPIVAGDAIITDNKGNVWARSVDLRGRYLGIVTHRGEISLSLKNFKGAQEVGAIKDDRIQLSFPNKVEVEVRSKAAILPHGLNGKLYASFDEEFKTERLNSVGVISSNREGQFLERIKERRQMNINKMPK